ncbi:MAG: biotin transporter BioY [Lachnospiraceae bacterium]|nr:biotin transporter BioY [Lachnospiraceae bacterium]
MNTDTNINTNTKTKQMTLTALAAAVICILSPFTIPIPISPVPVSLTVFAVCITAYVLGTKLGLIATALYILIGLVGIPVFSGFSGGVAKLLGPTGGYIIGYLFVALFTGLFADHFEEKIFMHAAGMVLGTVICYLLGTIWLAETADIGFKAALAAGVLPFIPADIVKILAALFAGGKLRKALRRM